MVVCFVWFLVCHGIRLDDDMFKVHPTYDPLTNRDRHQTFSTLKKYKHKNVYTEKTIHSSTYFLTLIYGHGCNRSKVKPQNLLPSKTFGDPKTSPGQRRCITFPSSSGSALETSPSRICLDTSRERHPGGRCLNLLSRLLSM